MHSGLALAVCTGNICRSPFVERMLAAQVAEGWSFASAGIRAVVGAPIDPQMAERIERLGGATAGFQARQLTRHILAEADLILALERSHRSAIVQLDPTCLPRVFTLREVGRIVERLPPTGPVTPDQVAVLLADYKTRALPRDPADDDVRDPFGGSRRHYDRAAATMEGPVRALARLLGR